MKQSAGILLYQRDPWRFFLVHPGGPFWKNKDEGAWSVPKGEWNEGEDPFTAAGREFREETGFDLPCGKALPLRPVQLTSGKIIRAWAVEGYIDAAGIQSNRFTIEWPPRSGRMQSFPEVDRAAWFELNEAVRKIHPAQQALLKEVMGFTQRPKE